MSFDQIKGLDFIRTKTVCFSNHDKPMKKGTILRDLADQFVTFGVNVVYGDTEHKPDVYLFEKVVEPTRYDGVKIIHAENLIGEESLSHSYQDADGIAYNAEWLRNVYRNTFPNELSNWKIIPPAQPYVGRINRSFSEGEYHIICISKWWKRPYKRFPLIAEAFSILNKDEAFKNAKLHVFGWLTDQPMAYTEGFRPIVKLSKQVRANKNIIYYQKSFHNNLYEQQLAESHLVVHLSTIDSGPQVVTEAFAYNVPVLISNNMGGAEWVKNIGNAGIVLELDPITDSYEKIKKLQLYTRKLCSNTKPARQVANAMKIILSQPEKFHYDVPRRYRIEGCLEEWIALIQHAWEHKYA